MDSFERNFYKLNKYRYLLNANNDPTKSDIYKLKITQYEQLVYKFTNNLNLTGGSSISTNNQNNKDEQSHITSSSNDLANVMTPPDFK